MPLEVQQMMLDRMDEIQAHRNQFAQNDQLQNDDDYLQVFKKDGLGSTLNSSSMARLKRMFEEGNLENELKGTSIKDDLDELYGQEITENDIYGDQPVQEMIKFNLIYRKFVI